MFSPDKDKPLDSDEDSMGINAGGPGGVGGAPASGPLRPNSAFLGPLLWERTLPCDGGLFQLQYMDLEEFLTENGMGMQNGASSTSAQIPSQVKPNPPLFFGLFSLSLNHADDVLFV